MEANVEEEIKIRFRAVHWEKQYTQFLIQSTHRSALRLI